MRAVPPTSTATASMLPAGLAPSSCAGSLSPVRSLDATTQAAGSNAAHPGLVTSQPMITSQQVSFGPGSGCHGEGSQAFQSYPCCGGTGYGSSQIFQNGGVVEAAELAAFKSPGSMSSVPKASSMRFASSYSTKAPFPTGPASFTAAPPAVSSRGAASGPVQEHFTSVPAQQHFTSVPAQQHFTSVPAQQHFTSVPAQQHFTSAPAQQHFPSSSSGAFGRPAVPGTVAPVSSTAGASLPASSWRSVGVKESFLPSPSKMAWLHQPSSSDPTTCPSSSQACTVGSQVYSSSRRLPPTAFGSQGPSQIQSMPSGPSALEVIVKSATNLRNADVIGKSDSYVIVQLLDKPASAQKSKVRHNNLNPEWNQTFYFPDFSAMDSLKFTVMDWDLGKKDDFLGECILDSQDFYPRGFGPQDLFLDQKSVAYKTVSVKVEKDGPLGMSIDVGPRGGVRVGNVDKGGAMDKLSKGAVVRGMLLKELNGQAVLSLDEAEMHLRNRPVQVTFEAHPTILVQVNVLNAPSVREPFSSQQHPCASPSSSHVPAASVREQPEPFPQLQEPFQSSAYCGGDAGLLVPTEYAVESQSKPQIRSSPGTVVPAQASRERFDAANSMPLSTGTCRWHAGPPSSYPRKPLDESRVNSVSRSVRAMRSLMPVRVHVGQATGIAGGSLYVTCELLDKPESRRRTAPCEEQTVRSKAIFDWNEPVELPSFTPGDWLKVCVFQEEVRPVQDVLRGSALIPSEDFFPHGVSKIVMLKPEQSWDPECRLGLGIDMVIGGGLAGSEELPGEVMSQDALLDGMGQTELELDSGPALLSVLIMRAQCLVPEAPTNGGQWALEPYCICEVVGKPHTSFVTRVASHTQNPSWNDEKEIEDYVHGDALCLTVMNKGLPGDGFEQEDGDKILGKIVLKSHQFDPFGLNAWLPLCSPTHRYGGLLRVRICMVGSPFRPKTSAAAPQESWGGGLATAM